MQQRLLKKMAVFTCFFALISISLCLSFVLDRDKYVWAEEVLNLKQEGTNSSKTNTTVTDNSQINQDIKEDDNLVYQSISFVTGSDSNKKLLLSFLQDDNLALSLDENLVFEENFTEHYAVITIDEKIIWENNVSITADKNSGITAVEIAANGNKTYIKISFDQVKDVELEEKNNLLTLTCSNPRDLYDFIVVIDPEHGGEDNGNSVWKDRKAYLEKNIALSVAKSLFNRKETENNDEVGIYFTRLEDIEVPEEKRVALANDLEADLLIGIGTDFSVDASLKGTQVVYNPEYFIPDFGSIELSDLLERQTVMAIGSSALGLFPSEKENIISRDATMPVAQLKIGYQSNAEDLVNLMDEEYCNQVADGIYNTILQAYTIIKTKSDSEN